MDQLVPFPEVVRKRAEELEISLREVARRADISTGSFSRWLAGEFDASLERMEALAHAVELRPNSVPEIQLERVRHRLDWRAGSQKRDAASRRAALRRAARAAWDLGLPIQLEGAELPPAAALEMVRRRQDDETATPDIPPRSE